MSNKLEIFLALVVACPLCIWFATRFPEFSYSPWIGPLGFFGGIGTVGMMLYKLAPKHLK